MNTSTQKTAHSQALSKSSAKTSSSAKKAIEKVKTAAVKAKKTAIENAESIAEAAVEETRASAEHVAATGKHQTEDVIRSISRAIEAGSRSLEQDGMKKTASYARLAADGLGQAASEVDQLDTQHLAGKAESIVRSNPMLTFGALALAGFALASAIKKTS